MPWSAKAQLMLSFCLLLLVISTKKVSAGAEQEAVVDFRPNQMKDQWDTSQEVSIIDHGDKRGSWKNFQGSWGKRSDDEQWQNAAEIDNGEAVKRGGWSNLHGTWGKRGSESYPDIENIARKLYDSYRPEDSEESADSYDRLDMNPLKRSWTNFAGTWGKRPYAGAMRTISPRSTNWSSLRGSWGKRADWSALRGAWGKRSN